MQRTSRTTDLLKASMTAVGTLALVGASFTGTAFATGSHGAEAHSRSTWTEDNDTNDGGTPNNVADAGDNRHPSGKDRSVEAGASGTQGRSGSDPDGMANGGPDKPNGSGGYDKADQDGNNGCGNDDDFEDDNNGNCGGKAHQQATSSKPANGCSCSTTTTTAKPATATHAKAEHGSTTCDRRNDEREQRGAQADQHEAATPKATPQASAPETAAAAASSTAAPAATTPAPAASVTTPTTAAPAVPAEVLSNSAVAAPASAESPAIPGEVLAAEAVAPAVPAEVAPAVATRSGGSVLAAAASGALAFTGMNLFTLLIVALLTIAVGWYLLRADRKGNA